MPHKLSQPCPIDRVEEADHVDFHNVPCPVPQHALTEPMERRVRAAVRAEAVRTLQKVLLENCAKHPCNGLLDHPILDRRDAERPQLAIRLWNVHAPNHWRLVAPAFQTCAEILQVLVQIRSVILGASSIYARHRLLAQ